MRQPPTNICPLLSIACIGTTSGSAECIEARCAWWDLGSGECDVMRIADSLPDVAVELKRGTDGR